MRDAPVITAGVASGNIPDLFENPREGHNENEPTSFSHSSSDRASSQRSGCTCWSGRRTPGGLTLAAAALLVGTQAHAAIILNWFPASDYNANTPAMDGTLGITGYTIDSFASTNFISGLTVTLSGGITTTTWASLPNLLSGNVCPGLTSPAWAGTNVNDKSDRELGLQLHHANRGCHPDNIQIFTRNNFVWDRPRQFSVPEFPFVSDNESRVVRKWSGLG